MAAQIALQTGHMPLECAISLTASSLALYSSHFRSSFTALVDVQEQLEQLNDEALDLPRPFVRA